jgi:low affinity Fe/Cu permease
MSQFFHRLAHRTSEAVGSPGAFVIAVIVVLVWAISGPIFHFSDTWQLVINTGTTILTFLMVFLIQNTQNRDAHAIHLKLDELIKAIGPARNILIDIENSQDDELKKLAEEFKLFREIKSRK